MVERLAGRRWINPWPASQYCTPQDKRPCFPRAGSRSRRRVHMSIHAGRRRDQGEHKPQELECRDTVLLGVRPGRLLDKQPDKQPSIRLVHDLEHQTKVRSMGHGSQESEFMVTPGPAPDLEWTSMLVRASKAYFISAHHGLSARHYVQY